MKKIKTLAIANRGEVAVRIIRAAQELGLKTVLLHSEADVNSLAYRLSDERVCIGGASVDQSYLNIEANVQGALSAGADAVHPGFGFLSENPWFAAACELKRIIFIGPSADSIHLFGDKISAKKLVQKVGGPLVPDYSGENTDSQILLKEADRIGYPIIVKASGGGGGRGLKIANNKDELVEAVESAKREGLAAFGSDRIFLEKYLNRAKHIEIQIFGSPDGHVFHLYERECSVQRRHQKVIEEAPSANLSAQMREDMCALAQKICKQAKYMGAGTVEFLVQDEEFYFMEMNTRLQVEHPVTEMILGIDLVKAQIMAACELAPMWDPEELHPRGHAIECRIYAENPYKNGIPSTGVLGGCHWPHGPGRRFEIGFEPGDEITPFYDSMIAKVVVWDETRIRAIQKMRRTLSETVIFGLTTNIPYLLEILKHQEFIEGTMTTRFIDTHFPHGLGENEVDASEKELGRQLFMEVPSSRIGVVGSAVDLEVNPWSVSHWEKQ